MRALTEKRRLGEMLLDRDVVTPAQLQEALARHKEQGDRLGNVLQAMGLVSEEEILETVSLQVGIPYFSLSDPSLDLQRVTDAFPVKFMQQYKFFPVKLDNGVLTVVMADPADVYTLDSIRMRLGCEARVFLGDEREISKALDQHYGPSSSMERIIRDITDEGGAAGDDEDVAHLKDLASEAPVIRLVNLLIAKAVDDRASDIHIEPFEGALRVRYRIDGILLDAESPPRRLQAAIISRIKLMAKMNIAERRLPQDGRIRMQVGGRDLDLRVSTIPTIYGESVVMRLLDRASILLGLDELGFPPQVQPAFEGLIRRPHGMLLVTGPTGSGKTTTLYAALQIINSVEKKIITIEDPVEYQLHGINQLQVKPAIGLTFGSGLRHIVRQDPDVILVGEIRDRETAEIAIHAALTGHLVLSTLHTNDAAGAITRLLDMGVEDYLVSSTLLAVLAQRLVRKICTDCKGTDVNEVFAVQEVELPAVERNTPSRFKEQACQTCNANGYVGRIGIFELLVMGDDLQRLVVGKADANVIRDKAVELGMKTILQDGWEKVATGMTTREEVLRVTQEG